MGFTFWNEWQKIWTFFMMYLCIPFLTAFQILLSTFHIYNVYLQSTLITFQCIEYSVVSGVWMGNEYERQGRRSWNWSLEFTVRLLLKERFTQKWQTSWKCTHSQALPDVDEFVSSLKHIRKNAALHHLLTNGSSAVNGCRQNESPNSWLKHHNNPQVIYTTPVH